MEREGEILGRCVNMTISLALHMGVSREVYFKNYAQGEYWNLMHACGLSVMLILCCHHQLCGFVILIRILVFVAWVCLTVGI